KGTISTESGALSAIPYSFAKRFGDEKGTNPEEIIGAAHAACFSMALSAELARAHITAEAIDATSTVELAQAAGGGFEIPAVQLTVTVKAPGADKAKVQTATETAKANCPVSKLLKAAITMDATYNV